MTIASDFLQRHVQMLVADNWQWQEYVVFLWAVDSKSAVLREYFDPTRAVKALDTPILGL